jgi:hypothetical protein
MVIEPNSQGSAPRGKPAPLWWDLQGKTGYRVFSALILDELCQGSDLSTAALLRELRKELGRSLSRQSLAAWRRGDLATPTDVMPATAVIVRRTLADAAITVVMRVLGDPRTDQRFAEGLRFYYSQGRPEVPPERPNWLVGVIGESRRRKSASRDEPTPMWRDLKGKTTYRVFGALVLDELCRETDINTEELRRRLRKELHRPMSRQSLAAWRQGDQSAPNDVLFAAGAIVHRTLAEATLVLAMRVFNDPNSDARLVAMFRSYLGHGRA